MSWWPPAASPPSGPPPPTPGWRDDAFENTTSTLSKSPGLTTTTTTAALPMNIHRAFEGPRKAPEPPQRGAQGRIPYDTSLLLHPPTTSPYGTRKDSVNPKAHLPFPMSGVPLFFESIDEAPMLSYAAGQQSRAKFDEGAIKHAAAEMKSRADRHRPDSLPSTSRSVSSFRRAGQSMARAATAPPTINPKHNRSTIRVAEMGPRLRQVHTALEEMKNPWRVKNRRIPVTDPSASPDGQLAAADKGKQAKEGDALSTAVLDHDFFPIAEQKFGSESRVGEMRDSGVYRMNEFSWQQLRGSANSAPPRLSFVPQESAHAPDTSPVVSPTDLSEATWARKTSRWGRQRRSGNLGRSGLSQITESETNANAKENGTTETDPTSRCPRLPLVTDDTAMKENHSPAVSDMNCSVVTGMHSRGGSVATVTTPPEATAWRRGSIYLHGPIRLEKPAVMPKKNSIASLEPFQEVVEDVYQHALAVPRRRSDDAVVDEICDFFDDYGLDIGADCEGSRRSISVVDSRELTGAGDPLKQHSRTLSTEPSASPVEVVIAQEVLYHTAKSRPRTPPTLVMPPVETAERLRARGIARMSGRSRGTTRASKSSAERRESLTLGKGAGSDGRIAILPAPEESMLVDDELFPPSGGAADRTSDAHPPDSTSRGALRGDVEKMAGEAEAEATAVNSDYSVEVVDELNPSSTWVAPAIAAPRKKSSVHGSRPSWISSKSGGDGSENSSWSRRPLWKMRRAVGSTGASAML